MSYFTDDQIARIRAGARQGAADDLLSSFLHSMIWFAVQPENRDLVAEMKPVSYRGRDGAFRGLLLINELSEFLEIALVIRAEFLRDRAENDKSG